MHRLRTKMGGCSTTPPGAGYRACCGPEISTRRSHTAKKSETILRTPRARLVGSTTSYLRFYIHASMEVRGNLAGAEVSLPNFHQLKLQRPRSGQTAMNILKKSPTTPSASTSFHSRYRLLQSIEYPSIECFTATFSSTRRHLIRSQFIRLTRDLHSSHYIRT